MTYRAGGVDLLNTLTQDAELKLTDVVKREIALGPQASELGAWLQSRGVSALNTETGALLEAGRCHQLGISKRSQLIALLK